VGKEELSLPFEWARGGYKRVWTFLVREKFLTPASELFINFISGFQF
jgi:hypothetical protein